MGLQKPTKGEMSKQARGANLRNQYDHYEDKERSSALVQDETKLGTYCAL